MASSNIYQWMRSSYFFYLLVIWFGIVIILGGCQSSTSTEATEQTPSIRSSTATSASQATVSTPVAVAATATPTPTATPDDLPVTLTFWTVEQISPMVEGETGEFVSNIIDQFEEENPDIEVNLLVKKPSGKGGMLDFLRTAGEVAPDILPDVVIMNGNDLAQSTVDRLIQPLDNKLDRSIVQDLLPAARRVGTVNDTLMGAPIGIDMEHTVHNTNIYTSTPILWSDVLSSNTTYLFPARGVNGLINDASLAQYFSAGGEFIGDQGRPAIDEQVLRQVLTFYESAREIGIIDDTLLGTSTSEELWPIYLEGGAGLSHISVHQYLTDRDLLDDTTLYSAIPIADEIDVPVSVMHAWVLTLVTNDINRQDAALRLLETFLSTENNAAWNDLNNSIPIRDTAYQQLAGEDPYWIFLTDQLNAARPEPRYPNYDRIGRILQQAVVQVIRGEATAGQATSTAIDALAQ